jgi:hypothetical protein
LKKDCRSSGNSIKKQFKFNPTQAAVIDLVHKYNALDDAMKEKKKADLEEKLGEEPVEVPAQREIAGIPVRENNTKFADKIEDHTNRSSIIEEINRAYIDDMKAHFAQSSYNIENGTATRGFHDQMPFHQFVANPTRRHCVSVLRAWFAVLVLATFTFNIRCMYGALVFGPLVFLFTTLCVFGLNVLCNLRYRTGRIVRTYTVSFAGADNTTVDLVNDQRALCNSTTDLVRSDPINAMVLYNDWVLRPIPRQGISWFKCVKYLLTGMSHHVEKDGCICQQRLVPCTCDDWTTVDQERIPKPVARFQVSFEMLLEILSSNLVVKGKNVEDVRSMLLSTAKRTHSINISRWTSVQNLIPLTVEFATAVVLTHEIGSHYDLPIRSNAPTTSGRFSQ